MSYLLWLDLETTGLNPKTDKLLQVSGMVTDSKLNPVSKVFDYVVKNSKSACFYKADEYVREMHTKTGLWDRIESGHELEQIDDALSSFVQTLTDGNRKAIRMAGSSPAGVDIPFTNTYLPKLAESIHYRSVDVSAIAFMAVELGWAPGYFEKKYTHNAVDDINESINELRWLNECIGEYKPFGL